MLATNIIQVTNVAPTATLDQMKTLFSFLGDIVNIELYHSDHNPETNFKVCFVEFAKPSSVLMAQHLTNVTFIDRTLIVLPYTSQSDIPDKDTALASISGSNLITNFNCGVVSQVVNGAVAGTQAIATIDPRLTALSLSQYPHLPINTDPTKVEEIRRTVYIGNLDCTVPPEQVLDFFNDIGEVNYLRIAGDDTQPTRFAFVEFTHQSSIANALQHNGTMLGSRALKINHSNKPITKPPLKIIDEASSTNKDRHDRDRRIRDRRSPEILRSRRSRSRSRSRDRLIRSKRSRSRDRGSRRRRSRSRSRSRDRSSRRRRSRSGERSRHRKSSRR